MNVRRAGRTLLSLLCSRIWASHNNRQDRLDGDDLELWFADEREPVVRLIAHVALFLGLARA